ncbi:GNAT superfamily N-acetyltransferase [Arthrobacter woluwensis]|uniref:GNAT family N-acetyltransferase n=1 Tax=Arthrobacter woluwensis TaxID=156980 RepID=UPI00277F5BE4|nr:GNAT family N-acetyltransferase [Arthrobacter woluwensis]MDQ0707356.1 GNAT superfamily N-acetyltransferase [Arthrobacter woluwensis]
MSEEPGMLAAYDSQLRLDAEAQGALAHRLLRWYPREGVLVEASAVPEGTGDGPFLPVMTAVFAGEAGFISHGAVGQEGNAALLRDELTRPGRLAALVDAGLTAVLDLAGEVGGLEDESSTGSGRSGAAGGEADGTGFSADTGLTSDAGLAANTGLTVGAGLTAGAGPVTSAPRAGTVLQGGSPPAGTPVQAPRRPLSTLEWKTRSHDGLPGLGDALRAAGFTEGEEESVMIGDAAALAVEVPLPDGVSLQRVLTLEDALALCIAAEDAFGGSAADAPRRAADLMGRLARGNGTEAWMAVADGEVVSGGRLEPVPGTDFAGIWGGFTLEEWRGQGIYRAVTAQRARAALAQGISLINSDSTDYSRPILERYGFVRVTGTTPFEREFG